MPLGLQGPQSALWVRELSKDGCVSIHKLGGGGHAPPGSCEIWDPFMVGKALEFCKYNAFVRFSQIFWLGKTPYGLSGPSQLSPSQQDHSRILGTYISTHPSLRSHPNPAPTKTVTLTQGRVGKSPETWIEPVNSTNLQQGVTRKLGVVAAGLHLTVFFHYQFSFLPNSGP